MKIFHGKIKIGKHIYEDDYTYFVRYLDRNVILDLSKLQNHLKKNNFIKKIPLGEGEILLVESSTLVKEGLKLLKKDIYYFLKEKPQNDEIN